MTKLIGVTRHGQLPNPSTELDTTRIKQRAKTSELFILEKPLLVLLVTLILNAQVD